MLVSDKPLAVGLYWLDVARPSSSSPQTPDGEPVFQAWLQRNEGKVRILRRDVKEEPLLGGPELVWYSFEVLAADSTPFPLVQLGRPTRHSKPGLESTDTVHTKPAPTPSVIDVFEGMTSAAKLVLIAVVVIALSGQKGRF